MSPSESSRHDGFVLVGFMLTGGWAEFGMDKKKVGVGRICQANEKMKIWQRGDREFS